MPVLSCSIMYSDAAMYQVVSDARWAPYRPTVFEFRRWRRWAVSHALFGWAVGGWEGATAGRRGDWLTLFGVVLINHRYDWAVLYGCRLSSPVLRMRPDRRLRPFQGCRVFAAATCVLIVVLVDSRPTAGCLAGEEECVTLPIPWTHLPSCGLPFPNLEHAHYEQLPSVTCLLSRAD